MSVPALTMTDVRKVYEVGDDEIVALDHASLVVDPDEIVALVGPSGSGKTTLCSIAGGILSPTSGSVTVSDEEITGYSPSQLTSFRQRKIGFVFQSINLVPFLTARENLLIVDEIGRREGAAARERADRLLSELELSNRAGHVPAQLSGAKSNGWRSDGP